MKITHKQLQQIIKEETGKALLTENPKKEIYDAYGGMMNLLMGRGAWEKAGGTPAGRDEAYRILTPYLNKLMNAFRKIPGQL